MLSDWTTLRAAASETSIVQPSSQWLDTRHYEDFVGWLEVKEFSTGSLTFAYQFSPTMDDSLFASSGSVAISATGVSITKLLRAASAVYGARYLRYQISCGGGVAWDLTFRCWVSASPRARRKRASPQRVVRIPSAPQSETERLRHARFIAGGDLEGTARAQTVAKLMGVALDGSMSSPTEGQMVQLVGGVWKPVTVATPAPGTYYGTYATRPDPTTLPEGTRYVCGGTEALVEFIAIGATAASRSWHPLIGGRPGGEVAPGNSLAAYTQVGILPTSVNTQCGCLYFSHILTGTNSLCGYERPKTGASTFTVHLIPWQVPLSGTTTGVGSSSVWVRDSSGGKVKTLTFGETGSLLKVPVLAVYNWNSLSSWSSEDTSGERGIIMPLTSRGLWYRIQDTGSSLIFSYSFDGINFRPQVTEAGSYWVPSRGDRWGFGVDPNSAAAAMTVLSVEIA